MSNETDFKSFGIFSTKELEFLNNLSKGKIDLDKEVNKSQSKPKRRKIIQATSVCRICGTVTAQEFLMIFENGSWVKETDEIPDEFKELKTEQTSHSVRSCWNCIDYLKTKPPEELALMIINLLAPPPVKRRKKKDAVIPE